MRHAMNYNYGPSRVDAGAKQRRHNCPLPTLHGPLQMRLAYSSNAYLNYSIEETIARIAGLGYEGLELLADVPHAWPAGLLPERKRQFAIVWKSISCEFPMSTVS